MVELPHDASFALKVANGFFVVLVSNGLDSHTEEERGEQTKQTD